MKRWIYFLFVLSCFGCSHPEPSLFTLFGMDSLKEDSVRGLGAEIVALKPSLHYANVQVYNLKRQDSVLQFHYADHRLAIMILEFKTPADPKMAFDSIAQVRNMEVSETHYTNYDSAHLLFYHDKTSFYHICLKKGALCMRRFFPGDYSKSQENKYPRH